MISRDTPIGTRVACVDTRRCFSICRCDGNHDLSPLVEGRVYVLAGFEQSATAASARSPVTP